MNLPISPRVFLLSCLAGWLNAQQQRVLDYLIEENRVLKEQFGGRRVRLTDDQLRRLAAEGRVIGRRLLSEVAAIVTPDTILRRHRKLIVCKLAKTEGGGQGVVMTSIAALNIRMA